MENGGRAEGSGEGRGEGRGESGKRGAGGARAVGQRSGSEAAAMHLLRNEPHIRASVIDGAGLAVVLEDLGLKGDKFRLAEIERGDHVLEARVGDDRPHR